MVHGAPDYGIYAPKSTVAALEDLAEAVARLGGIATFDRRGDVIYCDDYEAPIEKFHSWANAGCDIMLNSQQAYSGAQSVLFSMGGVADDDAIITHHIPTYPQGRHGVKISPNFYEMYAHASYYYIGVEHWNGSAHCRWGIKIDPKSKKLYYLDALLAYVEFQADFKLEGDFIHTFHNVKLVADLVTGKYSRLLINNTEWDMSAYSFSKVNSTLVPLCRIIFQLHDVDGYAFTCWQDDFVYTINEP